MELESVLGNARVEKTVSHAAVFERAALLVSHAGHGSVMKALWFGRPMVLVPWGRESSSSGRRLSRDAALVPNHEHLQVDGLRIAYQRWGDGAPLLLLHGYVGDSRATWHPQIEELSDEFTVVAWDASGAGKSSDPPASFRLPDYADCLAEFVDALGLGRPHIAGLSFGGGLAPRALSPTSRDPEDDGPCFGLRGLGGLPSSRGRRRTSAASPAVSRSGTR